MSYFPGHWRASKGHTKEMGGEEALGQMEKRNLRIEILRTRKKVLVRRKRSMVPCFVGAMGCLILFLGSF